MTESSLSDEPSNKGMKQTKPARAMELRSLSPVLGGRRIEEAKMQVSTDAIGSGGFTRAYL